MAITGAAGYLGLQLARRCTEAGARVLGLDIRTRPDPWPAPAEFATVDVTGPRVAELLASFRPTVVAHLAWVFDPTHDGARERAVDLVGTARVFRGAVAAGARRIVYPSSTTAYGIEPGRSLPYREEDPPRPNPGYPYAYYKARVEQWLPGFRAAHPEVELVVLRPCIVIGPGADNIVTRLASWRFMSRVAGHDPSLQFLHEEDAGAALWRAVEGAPGGVYNLAGRGLMRYSEVCRAAGRVPLTLPPALLYPLVAVGWRLRLLPFPPGLLDYIRYSWVAEPGRLEDLGFRPRHSTREAFAAYLAGRGR